MGKIEVLKQFTLVNDVWFERFKAKYGQFGEQNFVDNLCNEIFNYYNCLFNVLVFDASTDSDRIHIELTSNPLQHLTVQWEDRAYGVYVFHEGFFQISLQLSIWRAYGSYTRTQKAQWHELNFYYNINQK